MWMKKRESSHCTMEFFVEKKMPKVSKKGKKLSTSKNAEKLVKTKLSTELSTLST